MLSARRSRKKSNEPEPRANRPGTRWRKRKGSTSRFRVLHLAVRDTVIAATAAAHGWTVATRNTKDFAPLGGEDVRPLEGKAIDDAAVNPRRRFCARALS